MNRIMLLVFFPKIRNKNQWVFFLLFCFVTIRKEKFMAGQQDPELNFNILVSHIIYRH